MQLSNCRQSEQKTQKPKHYASRSRAPSNRTAIVYCGLVRTVTICMI
jgi:hypothetical protein